jgi:hypothetical protein
VDGFTDQPSKILANIRLEQFPLPFGHSRVTVLIVIFCIGKIDRSSDKDGSDYEQSRP